MASVNKKSLLSEALTASKTSDAKALEQRVKRFIASLIVSACDAATTVSAKLQHSANKSAWIDLATFSNVVGTTGQQAIGEADFSTKGPVLPYVRAVVTLAGVTQAATVDVALYVDDDK